MVFVIQRPGDRAYVLKCPNREGFLTWDLEGRRYLLMFTTGEKAEEYSERVLESVQGEVGVIEREDSMDFIKAIVATGVHWAIWDFPPEVDQYDYLTPTLEEKRNYGVVDLKGLVNYQNGKV